jgi:hypothetical protein
MPQLRNHEPKGDNAGDNTTAPVRESRQVICGNCHQNCPFRLLDACNPVFVRFIPGLYGCP